MATLEVAKPEAVKSELSEIVSINPETIKPQAGEKELEANADQFVESLMKLDVDNPENFDAKGDGKLAVETMGLELQKKAAHQSAMLQQPVRELSKRADDGGDVANALVGLKSQVESLDPAKFDFEPGWFSRTLGLLPGVGTPIKKYFSKFESAQTVIDAIVRSLEMGRDQLQRDNATLTEDQKQMIETMKKLEQTIKLSKLVDQKLQYQLDKNLEAGTEKYKFVAEELLFPLRQRIVDLQQQLAVNQQGVLAVEIIIRNNKELARGVTRALNVTVSALQVAATVALALADQKMVLDKVEKVNKTTGDLIANTAAQLKTQGAQIHKQAATAQLDMESLKRAFSDISTAMDDISSFRINALPEMAKSVLELDKLTAESQKSIDKFKRGDNVKSKLTVDVK